jgi:hypothetical protein
MSLIDTTKPTMFTNFKIELIKALKENDFIAEDETQDQEKLLSKIIDEKLVLIPISQIHTKQKKPTKPRTKKPETIAKELFVREYIKDDDNQEKDDYLPFKVKKSATITWGNLSDLDKYKKYGIEPQIPKNLKGETIYNTFKRVYREQIEEEIIDEKKEEGIEDYKPKYTTEVNPRLAKLWAEIKADPEGEHMQYVIQENEAENTRRREERAVFKIEYNKIKNAIKSVVPEINLMSSQQKDKIEIQVEKIYNQDIETKTETKTDTIPESKTESESKSDTKPKTYKKVGVAMSSGAKLIDKLKQSGFVPNPKNIIPKQTDLFEKKSVQLPETVNADFESPETEIVEQDEDEDETKTEVLLDDDVINFEDDEEIMKSLNDDVINFEDDEEIMKSLNDDDDLIIDDEDYE